MVLAWLQDGGGNVRQRLHAARSLEESLHSKLQGRAPGGPASPRGRHSGQAQAGISPRLCQMRRAALPPIKLPPMQEGSSSPRGSGATTAMKRRPLHLVNLMAASMSKAAGSL